MAGNVAYTEKVDRVVYESDAVADFVSADWLELALAALDQSGVPLHEQARVTAILERYRDTEPCDELAIAR